MANKERGEHEITVDGKAYILRYSTNALCNLESILNRPFSEVMDDFAGGKISLVNARALFFVGLQSSHKNMTIESAGDLFDAVGFDVGIAAVNEAVGLAFGNSEDDSKKKIPIAQDFHGAGI